MDIRKETITEIIKMLEEYRDSGTRIDSGRLLDAVATSPPKPKLVLCVGHSRGGDSGAISYDGSSNEWQYNRELASEIALQVSENIDVTIIDQYQGGSYAEAMYYLNTVVNEIKPNLVVELHFNSFHDPLTRGFETLYWHSSKNGKAAATSLQRSIAELFPNNTNRGIVPIASSKQRGSKFLRSLKPPCVILEPFFGSNPSEWEMFRTKDGKKGLAQAITQGLQECLLDGHK